MKICFFGTYDKNYTANKIVYQGLLENGVDPKAILHINLEEPEFTPLLLSWIFERIIWAATVREQFFEIVVAFYHYPRSDGRGSGNSFPKMD